LAKHKSMGLRLRAPSRFAIFRWQKTGVPT
jgi:hypothetical protein